MRERENNTRIIEENRRLQEELEESRRELRQQKLRFEVIANTFDEFNVNILNKDLQFVYVNKKTESIFESSNYPILGSSILDIPFEPEDKEATPDKIKEEVHKNGKYEGIFKLYLPEQQLILKVRISALFSETGSVDAYMILSEDITKQREVTGELSILRTAIKQSANIVLITDTDGNIEYANESFSRLSGYSKEEVIGRNPRFLKSGKQDEEFYRELWESISGGKTWHGEFENIKKNGEAYWVRATISPIWSDRSEISHYLAIMEDISEMICVQRKLKEKEEKFRQLLETSNDAIVIMDETKKVVDCNRMVCTLFGFEKEEIIGKTPADLSPEFQGEGVSSEELAEEYFSRGMRGEKQRFKWIHTHKNGTHFPAEVSLHFFYNDDSPFLYAVIRSLRDVQKIREELQKSEERFKLLSNISFEGIIIHYNGRILDMNTAVTRITGYTEEDIRAHKDFFFAIHPDYHATALAKMKEDDPSPYEIEIIHKDGHLIPAEIVAGSITFHNRKVRVSAIRDISKRKKVEKALTFVKEKAEYSEGILQAYINAVPDVICFKDGKGRWILANDAVLKLFHLDDVDYLGKTDAEISHFAPVPYRHLFFEWMEKDKEIWKKREIFHEMDELDTIEGEKRTFDVYKIPLYHPDNSPKGIAILGRDITEFHRIQEELLIAKEAAEESNLLKTRFLNNMSHEIRTPMNGIIGFSSLLKDNPKLPPEKQKLYINIIQNSSKQLLRIIDDILEISYLETKRVKTKREAVCINNLLLEAFSVFELKAKDKNISIYFNSSYTDRESTVYSDPSKIIKIIHNLIENAIKFTHKGYVEIGFTIDENLNIYVKDTGIGIHKSKQKSIFNRFAQEDKVVSSAVGGLGLGLSIAQENASLLGGKISVESGKGKGSTFTLTIPYIPVYATSDMPAENEQAKKDTSGDKILLAEDEEVNYLFFNILIAKILPGVKIIHAKNGLDAVRLMKENTNIKMAFMDIKMPGIDGYEAVRRIRSFNPDIPIIALTAYSTAEDRERTLASGFTDFISKPVDKENLKRVLKKYF